MSKSRDIANFLGKTEVVNTNNVRLVTSEESLGLDSAQVTTIATDAGIAVYTALDSLPSTGLSSGDQAWVESSGRLYISNGSGWYNVALVNASPSLSLDQSGTVILNADTLSVVVTASASDSDDNQNIITFSVESDGNMVGTGTTISQDSSVFTITALSADSGGTAGDFTLTFKATDQIAVDNETLSFSLSFTNVVDSSSGTVLLMKARDSDGTNSTITFLDSNNSSVDFANTNSPAASTFTPHRSGGYSSYFGGGNVGFYAADNAEFTLGTSDFCMEGWLWITDYSPLQMFFSQWATSGGTNTFQCRVTTGGYLEFVLSNSTTLTATGTQVPTHQWVHYAFVRNGSNFNIYQDGVSLYSDTSFSYTFTDTSDPLYVGRWYGSTDYAVEGYMHDVRFVVGSPVYTAAFTPPTEKLGNITNTKLLTCRLPYIADESTTGHALTLNGAVETRPYTPYNYEPWSADDHGGSLHIDGAGSYVSLDDDGEGRKDKFDLNGNSWTLRTWIYPDAGSGETRTIFATGGGQASWSSTNGAQYQLSINTSNKLDFTFNSSGSASSNTTTEDIPLNVWSYISLSHADGGDTQMHINGEKVKTISSPTYTDVSSQTLVRLGTTQSSAYETSQNFHGNIADFEFINGTAVYTDSDYTVPTAPVTRHSDSKLLMQNKSDASVYDASASGTFRLKLDTKSSTSDRKFTTSSSVYFDGTGDHILINEFADLFHFGSGDFTIEGWYKAETTSSDHYIISFAGGTTDAGHFGINIYQGNWRAGGFNDKLVGGVGSGVNTGIDTTTWHHFALVHASQNFKYYIDGTQIGSTVSTSGDTFDCSTTAVIGGYQGDTDASNWHGYLQDIRISKYARYLANFTAPTAEFEL
jgi:hypothetical protein